MKPFRWSHEKNVRLTANRGISFEEIVLAIDGGGLLDILRHVNQRRYPGQLVMVVTCRDYAYLVPVVEEADHYVLKTIIPSRKATGRYLGRRDVDEDT